MRGGALPLFAWGTLLVVLLALNWIWTGDAIQVGTFAYAALSVLGAGGLLVAASRQALKRGPPEPRSEPEGIPAGSLGTVAAALSVAAMIFGLAFGRFLVFFGAAMLALSLARITLELRSERRDTRAPSPREPHR